MFIAYSATVIDPSLVDVVQVRRHPRGATDPPITGVEGDADLVPGVVLRSGDVGDPLDGQRHAARAGERAHRKRAASVPATVEATDRAMLLMLRSLLVLVAIVATTMSVNSNQTMYEMVEAGYSVTLVVAFVPLVFGIYWKRATTQGAVFSILFAVSVWLGFMFSFHEKESEDVWRSVPPQLYGLAASFLGMLIGSMMPNWIQHRQADHSEIANRRSPVAGH